jgi:hypothetical protein
MRTQHRTALTGGHPGADYCHVVHTPDLRTKPDAATQVPEPVPGLPGRGLVTKSPDFGGLGGQP